MWILNSELSDVKLFDENRLIDARKANTIIRRFFCKKEGLLLKTQTLELPDHTRVQINWFYGEETARGVVLFLPAMGVSIDYYKSLARNWSGRGYAIALIESRGMRHSSVKDVKHENFGYKEILNIDLATLIPELSKLHNSLPIWLSGHSLGGQLALLHATQKHSVIAGIILIATGSNYYGTMPTRVQKLKRKLGFYFTRVITRLFGYFPGHKLGFGGRQPRNLIKDWTFEGLNGKYQLCDEYYDYNQSLRQLDLPILMISLSGDQLVPKSSADFLAKKLERATITQVELQASDYGLQRFNHFKWTKHPGPVLDIVDHWVTQVSIRDIELNSNDDLQGYVSNEN